MRIVTLLALTALVETTAMALPGIPNGTYSGTGSMQTPLGRMPYTSKLVLTDAKLEATYDYGVGGTHSYTANFSGRGATFDLTDDEGTKIGDGYCIDDRCHLNMTSFNAEETLIVVGDKLARVGSMKHDAATVLYTEDVTIE